MSRNLITAIIAAGALTCLAGAEPPGSDDVNLTLERIEASATPAKPYVLPDKKTVITVKEESVYLGRGGRTGTVQAVMGEDILEILPGTIINSGGFRFEFHKSPQFIFSHVRDQDMIFTVVESCTLAVLSYEQAAPTVALQPLDKTLSVACHHNMPGRDVYTIDGDKGHFVSIKPTGAEVSRFHPDPELGARLRLDVISSLGARSLTLDYKKKKEITIGAETISLKSFGFDYKSKLLQVRVRTVPKTKTSAARIIKYGSH